MQEFRENMRAFLELCPEQFIVDVCPATWKTSRVQNRLKAQRERRRHFEDAFEDLTTAHETDPTIYADLSSSNIRWIQRNAVNSHLENYYSTYGRAKDISDAFRVFTRLLSLCIHYHIHNLRHFGPRHDMGDNDETDIARAIRQFGAANHMTKKNIKEIRKKATYWIMMVKYFGWGGLILPGPGLNDV